MTTMAKVVDGKGGGNETCAQNSGVKSDMPSQDILDCSPESYMGVGDWR